MRTLLFFILLCSVIRCTTTPENKVEITPNNFTSDVDSLTKLAETYRKSMRDNKEIFNKAVFFINKEMEIWQHLKNK